MAQVRRIGEHAVVIGGSVGGLLAARSLTEAYERVSVVERDALPAGLRGRKAVPQGRHPHALLPHGQACLDALLPGFSAELAAAGAPSCAALEEMRFVIGGHQLARASTGASTTLASRPFIEGHVRQRIRGLPQVALIDGCDALGLTTSRDGERVTGVRILRRADGSAEETLAADLVVAATGRAARVPAWLEALGYPSPEEERLDIGVTYASRLLSLPADPLEGDKFVLIGARPGHPRTLFLFAQEGRRWILGLGGYGPGHRPPGDPEGFAAFAATVAPRDVLEAIEAAKPVEEIATHRFPASVRRRYDRLRRFPAGLLVVGDAICSFNPTYGQGMTVAAAQAIALCDCLERGGRDLARRFFSAAGAPIDHAWQLSVGGDLALPEVEGRRSARVRIINAYLRRVRAAAEHDRAVARAFIAVVGMLERPPHLLRPAIAVRVARGPRPVSWSERVEGVRLRELRVGDVRTPLREAGPPDAREAVVFLHGNPGSSADWEPLLAATGRRWRAVAWDAPGFGHAASPAEFPHTVSAHAEFVGRALDALGIERVHLVAHDFGGPWGLVWAASEPDRVASAVLLGTGALPGYRWHALARLWRTPHARELFMATTTRLGFCLLLRRGNPRGLPRPLVDRMYDDFHRATRRAVLDLYRSVLDVSVDGERLARALRPLDRPALVLWGRRDPYIPVAHAERERAAFPRAEIRVLERSGHWPFVDDPATVTAALTGFLARHAGAPTRRGPDRVGSLGAAPEHPARNAAPRTLTIAGHELAEPEAPARIHAPASAGRTFPPPSAR
jgi:pimeloyl-ACP methyl ester carboxylesterase/2-polyprenyl-6-methoxyphenol hydroxylase-like FAD-dependent oxidoreductase